MTAQSEERKKILVVDDSDIIRRSIRELFSEYDLEVATCSDGLEGIKKAIELKPSLILLDLMMPNLDGLKMLQVIKMLDDIKSTPVIVISANTIKSNVIAAIEAGADKVISKPLDHKKLFKEISEILGENFIKESDVESIFSGNTRDEIKRELRKFFVKSFPMKKNIIIESLNKRNREILKTVVHELKGTGASAGFPVLGLICNDIEQNLMKESINWDYIKIKCNEIFNAVEESV